MQRKRTTAPFLPSRVLLLLMCLAMLLVAVPPARGAAAPATTLTGRVTDEVTGAPVAGATVTVLVAGAQQATATSDAAGRFRVAGLAVDAPYQLVTIRVSAVDYSAWTLRDTPLYPGIDRDVAVVLGSTATARSGALPLPVSGDERGGEPVAPDTGNSVPVVPPRTDANTLQSFGHTYPPTTIRVARTGHKLCSTWLDAGRPVLSIEEMPFRDYIKQVLPNEWVPSWHPAALQAGAVAAKTFAWAQMIGGKRYRETGADVVDNTCDQYFVPGSQQASTNAAVDATWDYVIHRDNQVFFTYYRNYVSRCEETGASPCMGQWDSQYDALAGASWQDIITKYYAPDRIFVGTPTGNAPQPEPYRYSVVSRSPALDTWHSRPAVFELVLRNEGSLPWFRSVDTPGNTTGYAVHLATGTPSPGSDNPYAQPDHASPLFVAGGAGWWGTTPDQNRVVMVEDAVPPGATATFRFAAGVAPTAGVLDLLFTPVVEHLAWMEPQAGSGFRIVNNPYSSRLESVTPATRLTVPAGGTADVTVQMVNMGAVAWDRASTVLASIVSDGAPISSGSPLQHFTWLTNDQLTRLSEEQVPPGAVGTFRFTVQAPVEPGEYALRARPTMAGWWADTYDSDVQLTVQVTGTSDTPPPGAFQTFVPTIIR